MRRKILLLFITLCFISISCEPSSDVVTLKCTTEKEGTIIFVSYREMKNRPLKVGDKVFLLFGSGSNEPSVTNGRGASLGQYNDIVIIDSIIKK